MVSIEQGDRSATLEELARQEIVSDEQCAQIINDHPAEIPRYLAIVHCPKCGDGSLICAFTADQALLYMAKLIDNHREHKSEPIFLCDLDTRRSAHDFDVRLGQEGETVVGVVSESAGRH